MCGAAGLLAGCTASSSEVQPPRDQFYFPTGLAMSPDGETLYVSNSNSDLRFDSGTITPVDLDRLEAVSDAWIQDRDIPDNHDCREDLFGRATLICDETNMIRGDSSVRVGNFSTAVGVQELETGRERIFVAVRGDPSLTWIDVDPEAESAALECGGGGRFPQCDEEHRLTHIRDDPGVSRMTSEPFDLFVDSGNGYVFVTHLTSGAVTLAEAPPSGGRPLLADGLGGLFDSHPVTGVRGAVGVAGRMPGSESDLVYVTSRSESRVQMLTVARISGASFPIIVANDFFFLNQVEPSNDARDIVFSDDGTRAFVVNRNPPMLHVVDTSLNKQGLPRNDFLGGVELCQQASNLAIADVGRGDRVYVACFRDGQVWTVDPEGMVVEAITDVGRGPHALAVSEDRQQLYVTNFLEDSVAVVDLAPGSPLENRMALKIGRPRQSEED